VQAGAHDTEVSDLMERFAHKTGLSPSSQRPQRYLWTDAFAVCNYLQLHNCTGDQKYRQLALDLVDQVHETLGKHREDDPRAGWISGLEETVGRRRPTAGGLRIGKTLGERKRDQPYDEHLEWERDGQYYHYLTKWMHALHQMSAATGHPTFNQWGCELTKTAHRAFVHSLRSEVPKRMYWKMSVDLSYPLVASMGHHDPLDGFVTINEIHRQLLHQSGDVTQFDLTREISDLAQMCRHTNWTTGDPLGIGGLLFDACRVLQMKADHNGFNDHGLLAALLESAFAGLEIFLARGGLAGSAGDRFAFRELGLAVGLHALPIMCSMLKRDRSTAFSVTTRSRLERLMPNVPLEERIETFWLAPANRRSKNWQAHEDINMVLLATSLAPEGFLTLDATPHSQATEIGTMEGAKEST